MIWLIVFNTITISFICIFTLNFWLQITYKRIWCNLYNVCHTSAAQLLYSSLILNSMYLSLMYVTVMLNVNPNCHSVQYLVFSFFFFLNFRDTSSSFAAKVGWLHGILRHIGNIAGILRWLTKKIWPVWNVLEQHRN